MSFLAVVVLFPLLFWGVTGGCGLLVERLCSARLPPLLVVPLGFGTVVVVSQFTTWIGFLAPLTPLVLVALAVAGAALGWSGLQERWRARRGRWWAGPAGGFAVYLIVAAPVILSGRATFTGYLLDTTGAIQVAGAERLLHHAHNFSNGIPVYGTLLQGYFGNGYPSGGHGVLASIGWLSGQNLIWLYTVFQALELSVLALVLTQLASRVGLRPLAAAITGAIASVPALLYAYALMGSIKEITALPMFALMGALMVYARSLREQAGLRFVALFAIAGAAAIGAIGLAAAPWVGLFGLGTLIAAVPWRLTREDLRPLLLVGGGLALVTLLLALPTVGPLGKTLHLAKDVSNDNPLAVADPGNLLRPLKFIQVFGVWLGETHRVDPRYLNQTYVLMGVVAACVLLGLAYIVRRRSWGVLGVIAISLLVWLVLHKQATEWTAAKLLVILSPIVVFTAAVGAFGLMQSRFPEGLVLGVAVVFAVLASDALLYHATNLAPTARFDELASIGNRNAGDGPTLAPDFDEYAIYLLRKDAVDMPGEAAESGEFAFVPGIGKTYGLSYDLDTIALGSIERFKTIVMRRSPAVSRPPSNFKLVQEGDYYTVWRREGAAPLVHVGLGAPGWEPAATPSCASTRRLAGAAEKRGAQLLYAPRPANVSMDLLAASRSPNAVPTANDLHGRPQILFVGPARVEGTVRTAMPGRYRLWLGGSVDRDMKVFVDGKLVGAPSRQSGGDGTAIDVGLVRLTAGSHRLTLVRGGGDLLPDDAASTVIDGVVLEPERAGEAPVSSLAPNEWRTLCHRHVDWVELG